VSENLWETLVSLHYKKGLAVIAYVVRKVTRYHEIGSKLSASITRYSPLLI